MNCQKPTFDEWRSCLRQYLMPKPFSDIEFILFTTAYSIITCCGVLGNGLVIFIVITRPQMRTPRNVFITNLAISNFLLSAIIIPFLWWPTYTQEFNHSLFFCKFANSFPGINIFCSTLTISTIAIDRYVVIACPRARCDALTARQSALIAAGVWLASLLLSVPYLLFYSIHPVLIPEQQAALFGYPATVVYQHCAFSPPCNNQNGNGNGNGNGNSRNVSESDSNSNSNSDLDSNSDSDSDSDSNDLAYAACKSTFDLGVSVLLAGFVYVVPLAVLFTCNYLLTSFLKRAELTSAATATANRRIPDAVVEMDRGRRRGLRGASRTRRDDESSVVRRESSVKSGGRSPMAAVAAAAKIKGRHGSSGGGGGRGAGADQRASRCSVDDATTATPTSTGGGKDQRAARPSVNNAATAAPPPSCRSSSGGGGKDQSAWRCSVDDATAKRTSHGGVGKDQRALRPSVNDVATAPPPPSRRGGGVGGGKDQRPSRCSVDDTTTAAPSSSRGGGRKDQRPSRQSVDDATAAATSPPPPPQRRRSPASRARRRRNRTTLLLYAVSVSFAGLWLPFTLLSLYIHAAPGGAGAGGVPKTLDEAFKLLTMASTCVNPVLYGYLNTNFNREFKAILTAVVVAVFRRRSPIFRWRSIFWWRSIFRRRRSRGANAADDDDEPHAGAGLLAAAAAAAARNGRDDASAVKRGRRSPVSPCWYRNRIRKPSPKPQPEPDSRTEPEVALMATATADGAEARTIDAGKSSCRLTKEQTTTSTMTTTRENN